MSLPKAADQKSSSDNRDTVRDSAKARCASNRPRKGTRTLQRTQACPFALAKNGALQECAIRPLSHHDGGRCTRLPASTVERLYLRHSGFRFCEQTLRRWFRDT